jgi:hypothetical protein
MGLVDTLMQYSGILAIVLFLAMLILALALGGPSPRY